jgi:hypothetical protein
VFYVPIDPNSILDSVKKVLQVPFDYDVFDLDITMHINSVFFTLNQLGIGPEDGYQIEGSEETWDAFLADDPLLNSVKTYVYLRVKMLFDPPPNSFSQTAMKEQIQELEWRLNVHRENTYTSTQMTPVVSAYGGVVDGGVG